MDRHINFQTKIEKGKDGESESGFNSKKLRSIVSNLITCGLSGLDMSLSKRSYLRSQEEKKKVLDYFHQPENAQYLVPEARGILELSQCAGQKVDTGYIRTDVEQALCFTDKNGDKQKIGNYYPADDIVSTYAQNHAGESWILNLAGEFPDTYKERMKIFIDKIKNEMPLVIQCPASNNTPEIASNFISCLRELGYSVFTNNIIWSHRHNTIPVGNLMAVKSGVLPKQIQTYCIPSVQGLAVAPQQNETPKEIDLVVYSTLCIEFKNDLTRDENASDVFVGGDWNSLGVSIDASRKPYLSISQDWLLLGHAPGNRYIDENQIVIQVAEQYGVHVVIPKDKHGHILPTLLGFEGQLANQLAAKVARACLDSWISTIGNQSVALEQSNASDHALLKTTIEIPEYENSSGSTRPLLIGTAYGSFFSDSFTRLVDRCSIMALHRQDTQIEQSSLSEIEGQVLWRKSLQMALVIWLAFASTYGTTRFVYNKISESQTLSTPK